MSSLKTALHGQIAAWQPESRQGCSTEPDDDPLRFPCCVSGEGAIEIIIIKTTGDKVLDQPLADIGGKVSRAH